MTFASPLMGWFFAVAGPVVLLYLMRQRLRSRPVSTVLFWNELDPRVHSAPWWRRLRNWISLLLQLLFVALLVLALCRPLLPWQADKAASWVLVLDPSASMTAEAGGQDRWAEAKAAVEARIRAMTFLDEAALVVAKDVPEIAVPWTSRGAVLLEGLAKVEPAGVQTDVRPALELARNLAAGRGNGRVLLASDGVWTQVPAEPLLEETQVEEIGRAAPNAGLTLLAVRRSPVAPGEYRLAVRLLGTKGEKLRGELELLQNGGLVDAVPVEAEPDQPWQREWSATETGQAEFSARFVPEGEDALSADNEAEAVLPKLDEVEIAVVSEPNLFLEAALNALPLARWRYRQPEEAAAAAAARGGAAGRQLWIFNRVAPPEGFRGGKAILVDPPGEGFWGGRRGEVEAPLVSEVDESAGAVRFADFENVRIGKAGAFEIPAGAVPVVSSFGRPLVYGKWDGAEGGDEWLVIGFDLADSDLVYRTAFPILLGNLVQSMRQEADEAAARLPGPVETRLVPAAASLAKARAKAEESVVSAGTWAWFGGLPLWWWLALLGLAWLVVEYTVYHRRLTE